MNPWHYSRFMKEASRLVLVVTLFELLTPVAAWALTNGPKQPEFQAFEPLGTTGMVNEFTGGFTYNLPLLEVPGPQGSSYPINLAYHSGSSLEEDASWVGVGWSLNPGAINRNVRGFPDDHKDVEVQFFNKQPTSNTWTIGYLGTAQAFSYDFLKWDAAIRYNTFTGYSLIAGASFHVSNMLAVNYRHENGAGKLNYSIRVPWASIFSDALTDAASQISFGKVKNIGQTRDERDNSTRAVGNQERSIYAMVGSYLEQSMYTSSSSYVGNELSGEDISVKFTATADFSPIPGVVGINGGVMGRYSSRRTTLPTGPAGVDGNSEKLATEGYMYQKPPTDAIAHQSAQAPVLHDYAMTKEESWTSRDRYIFPGFQQYDIFSCSGQGVGGGMRMLNKHPGFYGPVGRSGSLTKGAGGFEPSIGAGEIAIGAHITIGHGSLSTQNLMSSEWDEYSNPKNIPGQRSEAVLRFQNDPADVAIYSSNDAPKAFHLAGGLVGVGLGEFPSSQNDIYKYLNNQSSSYSRPRQSSAVTYRTNADLARKDGNTANGGMGRLRNEAEYLNRLEPNSGTFPTANGNIGRGIGEISVLNNAGVRYVYGLPVYARNEAQLTYIGRAAAGIRNGNGGIGMGRLEPKTAEGLVGSYRKTPYASTFLLTEVQTPDYVDRLKDGPSTDDFGGYTAFSYRRAAGTPLKNMPTTSDSSANGRKWYRWRTPYTGYALGVGSLSLDHDDRAVVSSGEKELYYLSKIETKTHVAFFITNRTKLTLTLSGSRTLVLNGSGKERYDAYEAVNTGRIFEDNTVSGDWTGMNDLYPSLDSSWNSSMSSKQLGGKLRTYSSKLTSSFIKSQQRTNKSEYLERIVLVPRSATNDTVFEDPIQTVNLEYDYETMKAYPSRWVETHAWDNSLHRSVLLDTMLQDTIYGIAGSLNSALSLTQEAVDAKYISTRVGTKRYGKLTLKRLWTDFGTVKSPEIRPYEFQYSYRREATQAYASGVASNAVFNTIRAFDGTYEKTGAGADRATDGVQNPEYDPLQLDPWGSYRRDGYTASSKFREHLDQRQVGGTGDFDPAAWQLKIIRLPSGGQIHVHYEQNTYSYVQDQPALALVSLKDFYMDGDKTVCKVDMSQLPGRSVTRVVELIKDYVARERLHFKFLYPLVECGLSADTLDPKSMEWITGYATVDPADVSIVGTDIQIILTGKPEPKELMKEFVQNKRMGIVECPSESSPGGASLMNSALSEGARSAGVFKDLASMGTKIQRAIAGVSSMISSPSYKPVLAHSFLRIPCQFKYGGGIRVKRIFLYDASAENGAAALYGNEYFYEASNGMSNGVATNEPATIHEESALTRYMVGRDEPSQIEELAAGEDLSQFEGPFLGSVYPGPSVGYARVVIAPIVSTPTSPGYTIIEFNTARDYPLVELATPIETQSIGIPAVSVGPVSVARKWTAATQGHSLIMNSMHGRTKALKKCRGTYSPTGINDVVEETRYEYFKPGDAIPVLSIDQSSGAASIVQTLRGADRDVTMAAWKNSEDQTEVNLEGDIGLQFPFQFYAHCTGASVSIAGNSMSTGVISKVTTYASFEKRTILRRDGRTIISENVAFDAATGQPTITRVYDEYDDNVVGSGALDGSITSFNIPAWAKYPGMGQASINQGIRQSGVTWTIVGNTVKVAAVNNTLTPYMMKGDLICLFSAPMSSTGVYFYVDYVTTDSLVGTRAYLAGGTGSSGIPSAGWLEVVRSGRTNQLSASAGNVTTSGHGVSTSNPWDFSTNSGSINFVVNASMTTWSDDWTYDAGLYGSSLYDANHVSAYDRATRGKWRPVSTYTWRSTATDIANKAPYQAGRASSLYPTFNHLVPPTGSDTIKWIRSTSVLGYTPNGEAAYEKNAIGIPSAARFSHRGIVPSIIAKNAEPGSVAFLSFEDVSASTTKAHTGRQSFDITSGPTLCTLKVNSYLKNGGVLIRFWAAGASTCPTIKLDGGPIPPGQALSSSNGWTLYEVSMPPSYMSAIMDGDRVISVGSTSGVYIDDFRMQPLQSEATCYVYDQRSLLLVAMFDDQHYATIYKYDAEGRLKRKERETERGVFPIAETHYNAPSIAYATRDQKVVGIAPAMQPVSPPFGKHWDFLSPQGNLNPGQQGVSAKGNMLDLKLNTRGGGIKLFDNDSIQLPALSDSVVSKAPKMLNKNIKR